MKQNIRWIVLIGGLALLCVVAMVLVNQFREPGSIVRIYQNDELLEELPLEEDKEVTISAATGGYNTVVIRDGQVSVTEASCPDQVCVRQAPISHTAEPIVCLPNRLVVQVETDRDTGLDGVA